MKTNIAAIAVSLFVAACGGGGTTTPTPAPTPTPTMKEGLYLGTSFNFFDFAGLPTSVMVLEQQEVWVLDGRAPPKLFGQGTFAYAGKGILSNGSPADVFSQAKTLAAIDSNVLGERSMELRFGEVNLRPFVLIPQTAPINELRAGFASSISYDYNQPASIPDVAGRWGTLAQDYFSYIVRSPLAVLNTGELSAPPQVSGCSVAGQLKPRPSGKNVFNLSITLTGCADAGEYVGIAFSYIDTSNASGGSVELPTFYGLPTFRLIATNSARTRVFNMTTTR